MLTKTTSALTREKCMHGTADIRRWHEPRPINIPWGWNFCSIPMDSIRVHTHLKSRAEVRLLEHLDTTHLCGWIERIPGGTREK